MEIRYCCEDMECKFYWEEVQVLLREGNLKYCPFCGAKITETKCYEVKTFLWC